MITHRGGLAIAELVVYIPSLLLSLLVAKRHGFGRQLGWIYLAIFALIRATGSGIQIASQTNGNNSLATAAAILTSIGLSPLLLAMCGLLKRIHTELDQESIFTPRLFDILHVPTVLGLVLAALGGSDASKSSDPKKQSNGHTFTKVAIILFIIVWIVQSGIAAVIFVNIRQVVPGERRLVIALVISVPFLFIRLLYSVISAFDNTSSVFNPITGSVIVLAVMAVIEEFIVVLLYLGAGFLISDIQHEQVQHGVLINNDGLTTESGRGKAVRLEVMNHTDDLETEYGR